MPSAYADGRSAIADGDLIAVRGRRGVVPILTRWVTRSAYTHTAVAVWLDGGLWAAEINVGGNHLVPVSQLRDAFDVYDCPGDRAAVREVVLRRLRTARRYGVLDLFLIAARRLLGVHLGNSQDEVCSEFSARVYVEAGTVLDVPSLPAPDEVAAAVGFLKLRITV
jgi:hypothetical protein